VTSVLVAGALANRPLHGGMAWVPVSWALGLRQLGFDVILAEQIERADSSSVTWFEAVVERFGLSDAACLVHGDGPETTGLPFDDLVARAEGASLLVNLSGHLTLRPVFDVVGLRLYVDLDPGYTQLWAEAGLSGARLDGHDRFATVGLNVGDRRCPLPTGGRSWIPTLPPVLIGEWPANGGAGASFTTVAGWRNPLGTIEHDGRTFGSKAHRFRRLIELPHRLDASFELALEIDPADESDREKLRAGGWRLVEPRRVAGDPSAFRDYLSRSLAEFSVAQPLYAETASGWFSDRTAHYLASGRPAVVEDTGVGARYSLGEGLLTFTNPEEAAVACGSVLAEPERHRAAARAFAERHLDSDVVLATLMAEIGVTP
jgi:Glycosyl transferases group 1